MPLTNRPTPLANRPTTDERRRAQSAGRRRPGTRLAALLALCALFVLAACGSGPRPPEGQAPSGAALPSEAAGAPASEAASHVRYPITVTDDTGAALTFAAAPRRIASFVPSATDLLLALGAGDRIVAIDKYSAPQFPEVEGAAVMDSYNVDFEALVALRPDLVLTLPGPYLDQMHNLGLQVYILEPEDADGVARDLRTLGEILDLAAQGEQAARRLEDQVSRVAAQLGTLSDASRPKVFFEASANPIFTAGRGSYVDFLIRAAGGTNVFGDQETAYPQVTAEEVVARAPDVIIGTKSDPGLDELRAGRRPGWESVPAVRNGRIYAYDDALLVQPDTHVAEAIRALAHDLHPDLVPLASEAGASR
ncbi:MAG: ABC transporter substrate-binding protein [Clostridia bacterium]|nr:ABC transporter substrate-binding protein [Clostridia bacterium]